MNFLPRTWSRLLAVASLVWRPLSLQAEDTIEEFRAKAEQGDAKAQVHLGIWYDDGTGVVKDETKAAKWYRKAQGSSCLACGTAVNFC
jgi:TPR repeat protein